MAELNLSRIESIEGVTTTGAYSALVSVLTTGMANAFSMVHPKVIALIVCLFVSAWLIKSRKRVMDIAMLALIMFCSATGVQSHLSDIEGAGRDGVDLFVQDAGAFLPDHDYYTIYLDSQWHCVSPDKPFINRGGQDYCFQCMDAEEQECYSADRVDFFLIGKRKPGDPPPYGQRIFKKW